MTILLYKLIFYCNAFMKKIFQNDIKSMLHSYSNKDSQYKLRIIFVEKKKI